MGSSFKVGWWDRFLIGLAPRWGKERLRARAEVALLERTYDAAGGGRRTAGWRRTGADADSTIRPSLIKLRELSRDLRRNNGWARRAIAKIAVNTVGWGIEPKAVGAPDEVRARALEVWQSWADKVGCDYHGRMPFHGLQGLAMKTIVESGEVLVLREPASAADGLTIPLRIRVLEPDYLDHTKDGVKGEEGGKIVQGVEFDARGRRVAYWIFDHHPGSSHSYGATHQSRRVQAADVLHIYDVERAGQTRGVPWLCAAIAKLQDYDDYDDAVLMQQKVAACFGAFVQDVDGAGGALGEQDDDDEEIETLEPGHIQYLSPGQTVSFATPPSTSDHGGFSRTSLQRIAASLCITYEDLTGDYSQANFSSARMARLSHYAHVHDWRWSMLVPQLCDGVWRWAMETAAAMEGWGAIPSAEWSPPPMPMLEPDKEGLAIQRLVRSGARSLYEVIREQGKDPESHLEEIAEGNAKLDELGIWLDSDPRRTSAAGLTQARGSGGDEDAEEPASDE